MEDYVSAADVEVENDSDNDSDNDNDNDTVNDAGDLSCQSWYWGALDKEEANRILMAKEHGHFLVRDSSTSGEYTLVVRRRERVRNIRILRGEGGRYGVVSHRCDFGRVSDLILYLMEHPKVLHQHFAHIDLVYPVSKPESVTEAQTHELLNQLVLRNKDLIQQNERYVNHVKQRKETLQEIQENKARISSLTIVLSLFEEQLALLTVELSGDLMKPSSDGRPDEQAASMAFNKKLIEERVRAMRGKVEEEEGREKGLSRAALRQLEVIHQMRAVLSQLQQDVTFLRLRVEERGLVKDYLDLLLKDEKGTDLSRYDPGNWWVQCDRQEAQRLLAQRVPGTFLVRPCSDGGHALSIACAEGERVEARHCLIHMNPRSFQYGFHPDYCIFGSLHELVTKHRAISLSYYNSRLDVCLTYPINYRRSRVLLPPDPLPPPPPQLQQQQ